MREMLRSRPALWSRLALLAVAVLGLSLPAGADQKGKPAGRPKPKRFPDFNEVVKDMQATEGLFTIYRYKKGDKSRDPEKVLCKIPRSLLNQDLLFATSIASGGPLTGWMWNDYLIRWEIVGKQLKLVTPDLRYVRKRGSPVSDVVARTYNERYLAAVPIVTMTPAGDPVIDLGSLLKTNLAGVPARGSVRGDLSTWHEIKVFPDNLLVVVNLAIGSRQGGRTMGVAYAFRRLPARGSYKPRVADDRVGYFLTARVDWAKPATERETFVRYINRWKLEKRDPSLELSPPKQPIVFIIEKTVPIRWRRWVREGIEVWNRAFEKIGYVGAIVVQQQTEDNEYAHFDPEDARYNFFRWIVSGTPYAMGPSRADPRTGQILDADIIMDDSFVRAWMHRFDLMAPGVAAELKPGILAWKQAAPDLADEMLRLRFPHEPDPMMQLVQQAREQLRANGRLTCNYATGFQHEMRFIHTALIATSSGKKIPERFIGEAIREVVAHEVGHALGLRHNFKASSWLTLDEIKRRRDTTDEPTSASVMDYNPLLFFKGDTAENVRHFITPTIGPYDYWAIKYGYADPPKGKSEKQFLAEVASQCTRPEHAYLTDEDTMGPISTDPLSNRFDMGRDHMAWARSRFELCDELLKNLPDWAVRKGEPRYFLREAFESIWFERARNFQYLARVIGGQYFHRDHVGDPDARPAFVPVDPDAQREALKLLSETLFADSFFTRVISPELLNLLAPHRWYHFGMTPPARTDYPIHERINLLQWWTLSDILAPPVLRRVYDAELKTTGEDRFTCAELVRTLRDEIWKELDNVSGRYSDSKPLISSIRRGLQRTWLDLMLNYVRSRPGALVPEDVDAMVRFAVRELSDRIGEVLDKAGDRIDFATRAHLVESKSRIDRALEAQFSAR